MKSNNVIIGILLIIIIILIAGLGFFLMSNGQNNQVNAVNDTVFIVVDVLDVMGDKLHMRKDTLWISNGQKLSAALEEWMRNTSP